MKKVIYLFLLAVLIPGVVLAQEGDRRDDGHGGHGNGHRARPRAVRARPVRAQRAAVSPQFHSMGIHSYPKPIAHNRLMVESREHSAIAFPNRGPNGVAIHANLIARTNFSSNVMVRNHMAVITGPAFRANIVNFSAHETLVNHYYWHSYGGFNYCHYYDPWGYHWYGWYLGNAYFWTRWYNNHYWWYDPTYYRWCYWHDGGWWWQDPDTTTIYVYNNGNYVSSTGQPSSSMAPPASNVKSADYFSPDSTREVRVLQGGDAFLYDISGNNTFKPIYLGSNVTDVKFSKANNGGQILLMLKDGSFSTFDSDGNPIGGNGNSGAMNAPAPGSDQSQDAQVPANAPDPGNAPQPPPSGASPPSNPPSGN